MALTREQEADFVAFFRASWPALVRTAYLLIGDHGRAEDLVQTTLIKMHRSWGGLRGDATPMTYARVALVNQAISASRRQRVRETVFGGSSEEATAALPPGFDAETTDRYAVVDDRDAIAQALLTLPPRMRAVIVMRYFDDLTEAATADALGMSVGSVKSQTSRGLVRLREAMESTSTEANSERSRR